MRNLGIYEQKEGIGDYFLFLGDGCIWMSHLLKTKDIGFELQSTILKL